jgi:hypothetical protein
MSIRQQWLDPPSGWPAAQELEAIAGRADLVLLPDRVESRPDGTVVAAFREEAQAFRVDAIRDGLSVEMVRPEGSTLAAYREHAAEWVLPIVLYGALPIGLGLITNRIQRWMDERREGGAMPTLRYREARLVDGEVRVREIEGPADEVVETLRASAEHEIGGGPGPQPLPPAGP